jgi:hypothetical protein
MRIALIAAVVPLLASCASAGLYEMSDEWCAAHPDASVARCPERDKERRLAVNDTEHAADSEVAAND